MNAMLKRHQRAAEYHGRADDAAALAVASPLPCVRERHQYAAIRWRELAAMNERDNQATAAPTVAETLGARRAPLAEEDLPCIA